MNIAGTEAICLRQNYKRKKMTDTTDSVIGLAGGLLALGLVVSVAGKLIEGGKKIKRKASKEDSFW